MRDLIDNITRDVNIMRIYDGARHIIIESEMLRIIESRMVKHDDGLLLLKDV
jgi:hypothetical protein